MAIGKLIKTRTKSGRGIYVTISEKGKPSINFSVYDTNPKDLAELFKRSLSPKK